MQQCYDIFKRFSLLHAFFWVAVFVLQPFPVQCDDSAAPVNAELVAEAQPDECFVKLGSWDNVYNHADLTEAQKNECAEQEGTLKRNAGYLWGLTQTEDALWFGTGANIAEAGLGGVLAKLTAERRLSFKRLVPPFRTASTVFELDNSKYLDGELGFLGDYRPPRVFRYDLKTGELTDHTPDVPLLSKTYGLRSAGYLNGVAILAGPVIHNEEGIKGINLFAFDTANKTFLGSCNIRDMKDDKGNTIVESVSNIRKWLEIKGVLYTTVGTATGGKVLRWKGSKADPFRFEVVGDLDDQGTELVYHENRLFILSWPPSDDPAGFTLQGADPSNVCDIMMTKDAIPEGGLAAGTEFVSVWNVRDYEPDYITASSYGLGAAVSFDGYLYWGTMHVPFVAGLAHISKYPRDSIAIRSIVRALLKTNRQIALFRGKNFGTKDQVIELVYGDELLYQYQPDLDERNKWVAVPNNMGQKPLFGESGFGNKGNFYTWSMAVYNDQLYVGTFEGVFPEESDHLIVTAISKLINGFIGLVPNALDDTVREILIPSDKVEPGCNLYRFTDSNSPAILETETGFGQVGTYGIRNLLSADGALYMGTASSYCLNPTGGWALIKITTPDLQN